MPPSSTTPSLLTGLQYRLSVCLLHFTYTSVGSLRPARFSAASQVCMLVELSHRAWVDKGRGAHSDPVHFVSVIGRGGEQISRIQAESGCKIQIASGKGFFFHRSQFGRNQYFAKFSRFSTLLVARSLGVWVSIYSCCFSVLLEPDAQMRAKKTRADVGPETRPPSGLLERLRGLFPAWPLPHTRCSRTSVFCTRMSCQT